MKTIYFIRHGEADLQKAGTKVYQRFGSNLIPLSKKGIRQIKQTAKDPRLKSADLILSSPYTRALQSASILSKELNLDLYVETDLHEWLANKNYYYEDNKTAAVYHQEYIKYHGIYPDEQKNWESALHMKKRVYGVLEKYQKAETLIVVCHGMLIQAFTGEKHPENSEIIEFTWQLGSD